MQVTKKDILVAARGLIENKGWTQYAFARDAYNKAVLEHDPAAVRFCAVGALGRAVSDLKVPPQPVHALTDAVAELGYITVPDFNDDPMTTKADVLSLFDRAIELAQAGEAAVSKEGA